MRRWCRSTARAPRSRSRWQKPLLPRPPRVPSPPAAAAAAAAGGDAKKGDAKAEAAPAKKEGGKK